ncbi:flagellar hook-associated protein FlgK [Azospirillum canadense]|uniref:flagellar hook-associated protein FlgK n=1 Tax=Azospirillum canadense TaxID=403962 RepID=UPI002227FBDA|nr:flagellar hook-associated protein FlgK [Azospirillum canadense]MCW2239745.1 flagellar hook-associated protein 1 FlgK [Azospirillum canadense]
MSLSVATSIISASLRTTEVASAVAASNVANADTAGYTRKTAAQAATDTAVGFATVDIPGISSTVDQFLLKTLIGAQPGVGSSKTLDSYLDQAQQVMGTTNSDSALGSLIDGLDSVLGTLSTSPESESAKSAVLSNLNDVATALRGASSQIQDLRGQADKAIATTVGTINTALTSIGDLNDQIVKGKALGQNTGDLEDQRNEALKTLSQNIGVRYQVDGNGMMRVSTDSGAALVDSTVHTLSYSPAASVGAGTVYNAGGGSGFQGIMVSGRDITTSVGSGTLGALVSLRDTLLPQRQATLDQLAGTLKDTLNGISNAGTASPPPNTLTGNATVSGTDALNGSGTLRVAVTDADGKAVEVQEFDLSSYATVQDAVSAIDGMANLSASISADGKLVIKAASASNGVALGSTGTAVGNGAKGFSAAFGLNDLLTGTSAADLKLDAALAADSSRLSTSALSTAATLAAGDVAVSTGDGSTAQALSDAFSQPVSFAAAGDLTARKATFASYAGSVIQAAATAADKAASTHTSQQSYADGLDSALSSQSGVNVNEETAAVSSLQSAYQASAAVMKVLEEMFQSALGMLG